MAISHTRGNLKHINYEILMLVCHASLINSEHSFFSVKRELILFISASQLTLKERSLDDEISETIQFINFAMDSENFISL